MQQLRITPWPNVPLPDPDVWRPTVRIDTAGRLVVEGGDAAPLSPELGLRELRDLELDDELTVVAFLNSYGAFTSAPPVLELGSLDLIDWPQVTGEPSVMVHVCRWLRAIRAATNHWKLHRTGAGSPLWAWTSEGFAPGWERCDGHTPSSLNAAWAAFEWVLTAGLGSISPRVDVEHLYWPDSEQRLSAVHRNADVFTGLCVQLFNFIVEGVDFHVCQNETCGCDFVYQRGRAQHGQLRSKGVIYCSDSCAKSQVQRAYRRRKRAAS